MNPTPHQEGRHPSLWFVLVNYHGIEDTLECLASLSEASAPASQIVVVDNGSPPEQADLIEEAWPSVVLHRNHENQGWSGGNNRGIEIALERGADWVLLLNNDTVVHKEIVERLSAVIQSGEWDVFGPMINEFHDRHRVQSEGIAFNRKDRDGFFSLIPVKDQVADRRDVVETDIVNGCAVAASRRVFEEIGLIDERFFLICEESDFCLRAKQSGFRVGVLADSLVWHKHSVSFARAGKPLQHYYGIRNLRLLLRRHAAGANRRGNARSVLAYYRHAFHIFSHERELGNKPGARAVVEGLIDALLGRFGVQPKPFRIPVSLCESVFWLCWKIRGGHISRNQQGDQIAS